jgi:hypothetical protein
MSLTGICVVQSNLSAGIQNLTEQAMSNAFPEENRFHVSEHSTHHSDMLSINQKGHHVAVCSELKEQTINDPNFISTIITGDES